MMSVPIHGSTGVGFALRYLVTQEEGESSLRSPATGTGKDFYFLTYTMAASTFFTLLIIVASARCQSGSNILSFVNPLIGTNNGGHVFPGATLPFGMAKAGADVNGEDQGGFATDGSNITGFSHMHDSGTGGASPPFLRSPSPVASVY